MGHSNPKLAGGLKMKAFYESPYGDDAVSELMNHQVDPSPSSYCVQDTFILGFSPRNRLRSPVQAGVYL